MRLLIRTSLIRLYLLSLMTFCCFKKPTLTIKSKTELNKTYPIRILKQIVIKLRPRITVFIGLCYSSKVRMQWPYDKFMRMWLKTTKLTLFIALYLSIRFGFSAFSIKTYCFMHSLIFTIKTTPIKSCMSKRLCTYFRLQISIQNAEIASKTKLKRQTQRSCSITCWSSFSFLNNNLNNIKIKY